MSKSRRAPAAQAPQAAQLRQPAQPPSIDAPGGPWPSGEDPEQGFPLLAALGVFTQVGASGPAQACTPAAPPQAPVPSPRGGSQAPQPMSARFAGDPDLAAILEGTSTLGPGDRGTTVTKLQVALLELGHLSAVTGVFDDDTRKAVEALQRATTQQGTTGQVSGRLDGATLAQLHEIYAERDVYATNGVGRSDPTHGTRPLSPEENVAALEMTEPLATGQAAPPGVFTETICSPDGKKRSYRDRIQAQLESGVDDLHTKLHTQKVGAPKFEWGQVEDIMKASKAVTDAVYGSQKKGPEITHASGNLKDAWQTTHAQIETMGQNWYENEGYSRSWPPGSGGLWPTDGPDRANDLFARQWLKSWVDDWCAHIHREHNADTGAPAERAIIEEVVEGMVRDSARREQVVELVIAWPAQTGDGGAILFQIRKSGEKDKTKASEENRFLRHKMFHIGIHEYIHTLEHSAYEDHHTQLTEDRDPLGQILREGVCDFFTKNVRANLTMDAKLRQLIEGGDYEASAPVPDVKSYVYASAKPAERMVSIIGIFNLQRAFFHGEVHHLPDPSRAATASP